MAGKSAAGSLHSKIGLSLSETENLIPSVFSLPFFPMTKDLESHTGVESVKCGCEEFDLEEQS